MFSYKVEKQDDTEIIYFSGIMNEDIKPILAKLQEEVGNVCRFNFQKVDCVTSLGVRFWLAFLAPFENGRRIEYDECSHEVVQQINIFPSFLGRGTINSFYGAFTCPSCGYEETILFKTNTPVEKLVELSLNSNCSSCGEHTELDEDERSFFSFLE